jgi:uncharacterized membrane protein
MPNPHRTFAADFKRFFGKGLAILLPSILTLWLLWYAFAFVFNNVAVPINRGIRWGVVRAAPYVVNTDPKHQPAWFQVSEAERAEFLALPEGKEFRNASLAATTQEVRAQKIRSVWQSRWYLNGSGLIVAIILLYLAGMVLGGIIGRRMYARVEAWISRLPGFKQVYPHVKQLVHLVIGESEGGPGGKAMAFKRVVLVEYPRKGLWTVGLVTSTSMRAVAEQAQERVVAVFIPSTPTPFTGFVISVAERDVVDVPISVDEAIRFVLTGGVLIPEHQKSEALGLQISRTSGSASSA